MKNNDSKFSLALVTGANSGIGEALCYLLAAQGINLIISGQDLKRLAQVQENLQNRIIVTSIAADISTSPGRQLLIELIRTMKPDLVINNAGFGLYGEALNHPIENQMKILNVNSGALLEITLEAAEIMKKQKKGVILNVASVAAFYPFPNMAVYAAAKAFVVQFSQALDIELEPYGVRILTSCPGMVNTAFSSKASDKAYLSPSYFSMSPQFAAKEIWLQICKGKTLHIFGWQYRLAYIFSRIIPNKFLSHFLGKIIANRLSKAEKK